MILSRLTTWIICAALLISFLFTGVRVWQSGSGLALLLFPLQWALIVMCLYTFLPAVIALAVRNRRLKQLTTNHSKRYFLLLIPAHNEAEVLPQLLESIAVLDYPKEYFQTLLVADNCTDQTAQIGSAAGIKVYERFSNGPSDKTQALKAASEFIQSNLSLPPGCFVVILDADGVLPPDYLLELDLAIAQHTDPKAIQTNRAVLNKDTSRVATLDAASEALRQRLQSQVRETLGLENSLYGLGSAFRADIFHWLTTEDQLVYADDKAWKAHLTQRGIPILHARKAMLFYQTATQQGNFARQRLRWVSGHYDMIRRFFLPVLGTAIRNGNASALDFAATIITLPRSFLLFLSVSFCAIAVVWPQLSIVPWQIWCGLMLCFPLYAALGLSFISAKPQQYAYLFGGLTMVSSVVLSNMRRLLRVGESQWVVHRAEAKSPEVKAPCRVQTEERTFAEGDH